MVLKCAFRFRQMVVLFSALLLSFSVLKASADEAEEVARLVQKNTDLLVVELNKERKTYETDPELFYQRMESALAKTIDFKRIAARVMGKYVRKATKEQRGQFLEVFKKSLFDAYARALVESGDFEVEVTGAALNPRSDKKATVELRVVASTGSQFDLVYSMHRGSEGWLMENVIVNGVNIGLAFRERFASEMVARNNDVDQVIANWSSKLEAQQSNAVN